MDIQEEICKKFPKICNCPYKEDIDKKLQHGETPYAISKWLNQVECPISYKTISRYKKYLVDHSLFEEAPRKPKIKPKGNHKQEIFDLLEEKLLTTLTAFNPENASDNVKVQLILGAIKLLYPEDDDLTDITPELSSLATDERTIEILNERAKQGS